MNLEDILLRGTRSSQPVATSVPEGQLYSITDQGYLVEQSRGGVWVPYTGSTLSNSSSNGSNIPFGIDGQDGEEPAPLIIVNNIPVSGGGGSSAWTLVGTWDFSVGIRPISFIGLAGKQEILIIFRDLLIAASEQIYINVSINNGVSYLNTVGDYKVISTTGALSDFAWFRPFFSASNLARSGFVTINPFSSANLKVMDSPMMPFTALVPTLNALNALEFSTDVSNFTGGSIRVYGR